MTRHILQGYICFHVENRLAKHKYHLHDLDVLCSLGYVLSYVARHIERNNKVGMLHYVQWAIEVEHTKTLKTFSIFGFVHEHYL